MSLIYFDVMTVEKLVRSQSPVSERVTSQGSLESRPHGRIRVVGMPPPQTAEELVQLLSDIGNRPRFKQDGLRLLRGVSRELCNQPVDGFTAPFYALLYIPNDAIVQALEIIDCNVDLAALRWGDDGLSPLMVASQQLKSAAVHWLLVNKRADPGDRRTTILCPLRRCWEAARRAARRLGQVAVDSGRLTEEQATSDVDELIEAMGQAGDTVELCIGRVRRLLEANDLPLSPETLVLVFGEGTVLKQETALQYVRRTVVDQSMAAKLINELEDMTHACRGRVAQVFEEIQRPTQLLLTYDQVVALFEDARRAATLELLRQRKVNDRTLRLVLELPTPLAYRDIVRTLQTASPQTGVPFSIELWGEYVLGACQERLMRVLRERGVNAHSVQVPRLTEATGEGGLQFLLALRRSMLRGDLIKHMGGDHALLVNFRDPNQDGLCPLTVAARVGNAEAIEELRSLGADVNQRDDKGRPPLHYVLDGARQMGHSQRPLHAVLDALWGHRADGAPRLDLHPQDATGLTPLMHAAALGCVEGVRWLMGRTADEARRAQAGIRDNKGWTALLYATQCKDKERLPFVLRELAPYVDMNHQARRVAATVKACLGEDAPSSVAEQPHRPGHEISTHSGVTALMLCAAQGHLSGVSELLTLKADVFAADEEQWTALHHVLSGCRNVAVCRAIVKLLREFESPSPHGLLNRPTKQGTTPLVMAIARKSLDLLTDLLHPLRLAQPPTDDNNTTDSPAADPNASDSHVESALSFCVRSYDPSTSKLQHAATTLHMLHQAGADVNAMSPTGESPLMLAAQLGKVELLQVLLQLQARDENGHGTGRRVADPNLMQKPAGFSALFFAVSCADEPRGCAAIDLLVKHGAEVNQRHAQNGSTPLMLAAEQGRAWAASLLLQLGAQPDLADSATGATALMYAIHTLPPFERPSSAPRPLATAHYVSHVGTQLGLVKLLVEQGKASPFHHDHSGQSLLMRAVHCGLPEVVTYLLTHAPPKPLNGPRIGRPELCPDHTTCPPHPYSVGLRVLDFALSSWDRVEDPMCDERAAAVLAALGEAGCSFDVGFGPERQSLLVLAAKRGFVACVALLVQHCPSILRRTDASGLTTLHHALLDSDKRWGSRDLDVARVVELLSEHGADLRAKTPKEGLTPLMLASARSLPQTVALLLRQCPAAVADVDRQQRSAIDHAIRAAPIKGQTSPAVSQTLGELLSAVWAVGCAGVLDIGDKGDGLTPLHLTAAGGHLGLMRQLLSMALYQRKTPSGIVETANITETKDRQGRGALHLAVELGAHNDASALQMVQVLLDHGAPPMAVDLEGRNVLMLAANKGYARTVLALLQRNATLACKTDLHQRCALHYASQRAAAMNRLDRQGLVIMEALVNAMGVFGGAAVEQLLSTRAVWLPSRRDLPQQAPLGPPPFPPPMLELPAEEAQEEDTAATAQAQPDSEEAEADQDTGAPAPTAPLSPQGNPVEVEGVDPVDGEEKHVEPQTAAPQETHVQVPVLANDAALQAEGARRQAQNGHAGSSLGPVPSEPAPIARVHSLQAGFANAVVNIREAMQADEDLSTAVEELLQTHVPEQVEDDALAVLLAVYARLSKSHVADDQRRARDLNALIAKVRGDQERIADAACKLFARQSGLP